VIADVNRDTLVSKNVSRNRLAPGVPFSPLQSSLVCLFSLPPLPFYSPPRPREGRVQGVVGSGRKKRNTVSYILSSNEAPQRPFRETTNTTRYRL
jgi:hypothetical protein